MSNPSRASSCRSFAVGFMANLLGGVLGRRASFIAPGREYAMCSCDPSHFERLQTIATSMPARWRQRRRITQQGGCRAGSLVSASGPAMMQDAGIGTPSPAAYLGSRGSPSSSTLIIRFPALLQALILEQPRRMGVPSLAVWGSTAPARGVSRRAASPLAAPMDPSGGHRLPWRVTGSERPGDGDIE